MRNILLRSLSIATVFSIVILLVLGLSEQTGNLWIGSYVFVFAVVAYGLMLQLGFGQGPSHLPVLVEWLTLVPAMVLFYTPIVTLLLLLRAKHRLVPAARPN